MGVAPLWWLGLSICFTAVIVASSWSGAAAFYVDEFAHGESDSHTTANIKYGSNGMPKRHAGMAYVRFLPGKYYACGMRHAAQKVTAP